MNVLQEMARFQIERGLHKRKFDLGRTSMYIIEELLEAHGVHEDKDKLMTNAVYAHMAKLVGYLKTGNSAYDAEKVYWLKNTHNEDVDAFCDIQEFACGAVMQQGYDNEKALEEMTKEINSREGSIYEGKFVKFEDDEAKAKWYKANYENARIQDTPRVVEMELKTDLVQASMVIVLDGEKFGHAIKFNHEIDEAKAIELLWEWKKLMLETN